MMQVELTKQEALDMIRKMMEVSSANPNMTSKEVEQEVIPEQSFFVVTKK